MCRFPVRALFAVTLLFAAVDSAAAQSYTWTATSGGSFQTATNWSSGHVPNSNDTVVFNANAIYTVSFAASATQTYGLTLQQGNVTLDIGAAQIYYVTPQQFLMGTVSGQTANLTIASGTFTPQSPSESYGEFVVGYAAGSTGNLMATGAGTVFYTHCLFGVGFLGTGTLAVQNNASAVIDAAPLVLGFGSGSGTVTVSSGGTFAAPYGVLVGWAGIGNFAVNGGGSATVDNFEVGRSSRISTISVGDGTTAASLTVTNNSGQTVSMTIGSTGTGVLNVNSGGTLTGTGNVVFGGASEPLAGSGTGTVSGTWNQSNGTISLGTTDGSVVGTGSLTINSGGALTVSGSGAGISTIAGNGTMTINAGGAVNTPTLTNNGTLNLQGGTLTTGTGGGSGLMNAGIVTVSAASDVYGPVQNQPGGQIVNASGGDLTFHDAVIHNGQAINTTAGGRTTFLGSMSGTGPYTGSGTVEFDGAVQPGNSPAIVTFGGNLVLGQSATLAIVLGGTAAGSQYDQLAVTGTAALNGGLDLSLINGFVPQIGQQFDILTYGAYSGNFTSETGWDLGNGLLLMANVTPNSYSLVVTPVPEPRSLALIGALAGTAGVWFAGRRLV